MKLQSIRDLPSFNILDYLKSEEDIAGYMQAVLEDGDAELLAAALLDVEEARRTLQGCVDSKKDCIAVLFYLLVTKLSV